MPWDDPWDFRPDDYEAWVGRVEALYRTPEEIAIATYGEDEDQRTTTYGTKKSFSSEDVIRIYNDHLTMYEKGKVKAFFTSIIPQIVNDINTANVWNNENLDRVPESEMSVQALTWITFWDLFYETARIFRELYETIKYYGGAFDVRSAQTLWNLKDRIIFLVNNWWMYIGRVYSNRQDTISQTNKQHPWWHI